MNSTLSQATEFVERKLCGLTRHVRPFISTVELFKQEFPYLLVDQIFLCNETVVMSVGDYHDLGLWKPASKIVDNGPEERLSYIPVKLLICGFLFFCVIVR